MMSSYRDPAFQDRMAASADARKKALDRLKAKPPIDPAVVAAKLAAAEAKEAAQAEKRAAKKLAAEEAAAAKAEAALKAKPVEAPKPTEAELKAARDRRYALRKARK
jgi:peptidoglycan hydrolase CwlO-like protein